MEHKIDLAALLDAANKAVMNKDYETGVAAPTGFDPKSGTSMQLSHKDRSQHGIVDRMAFNVDGQLYLRETVMTANGDTEEVWKRAKTALSA
jgi:hypothetical protein